MEKSVIIKGLVDVIIPTFNRSALCKQAVESVLSQSYDNVHVIVIDDGSSDDTKDVINGFDERIEYIRQKNRGVATARNTGLNAARGEFIAFLDSDDIWLPWKLETQINVLHFFPEVGMVWTDMLAVDKYGKIVQETFLDQMYNAYQYFDRNKNFIIKRKLGDIWDNFPAYFNDRVCSVGNIFPWMFMGNLVHTSTVVMRRDRQEKVGYFNTDLKYTGEDYDFHLRTCKFGPVAYIDVSSIKYQIGNEDQLTSDKLNIWMARNSLKTIEMVLFNDGEKITLPESMIKQRMANSYFKTGVAEILCDKYSTRKNLKNSLEWDRFRLKSIFYFILSFFPCSLIKFLRSLKRSLNKNSFVKTRTLSTN